VSSARNLGLDNAQGEYITFCDADDYVAPDWLAAYRKAMAENIDLAIQGYYSIEGVNAIAKSLQPYQGTGVEAKRQLISSLFSQEVYYYLWVKLFRRDLLEAHHIRFDEQSILGEDTQFISKYLEYAVSFMCIDTIGYYYIAPAKDKRYGLGASYTSCPILSSMDTIFEGNIPTVIYKKYNTLFRNYTILQLIDGQSLSSSHLSLYRRMVVALDAAHGFKNRLLNFLIIHSNRLGSLSCWSLRLIHRLTHTRAK
jgi:glycosyltransferase involved in cell wall biosynthesis